MKRKKQRSLLGCFAVLFLCCGGLVLVARNPAGRVNREREQPVQEQRQPIAEPPASDVAPEQPAEISDSIKRDAITLIKQNDLVRGAAIEQSGHTVDMTIVVDESISETYAKKLGENFIRMVKGRADEAPDKEVGTGKYDYTVTVVTLTKRTIATGVKPRVLRYIRW